MCKVNIRLTQLELEPWLSLVIRNETNSVSVETLSFQRNRDQDLLRPQNFKDVETETQEFGGCQDRDTSRLRILEDVKTKIHRDSKIWRMPSPRPTETHQKVSRPRPRVSLLTGVSGCVRLD